MLSERLAPRRDLKIFCNIPLTEYRLDVVSTRSRHVLAYGWPQPYLDIQITSEKHSGSPFVRLSSPPKNRLLEAPSSRSLFWGSVIRKKSRHSTCEAAVHCLSTSGCYANSHACTILKGESFAAASPLYGLPIPP
jgi:hypothetical protein